VHSNVYALSSITFFTHVMETIIYYTSFILVFFLFNLTIREDNETFIDISIRDFNQRFIRYFLITRRFRVALSYFTLGYFSIKMVLQPYLFEPILNLYAKFFSPDKRFFYENPTIIELCILNILCIAVFLILKKERKYEKQTIEEIHGKQD